MKSEWNYVYFVLNTYLLGLDLGVQTGIDALRMGVGMCVCDIL